MSNNVPEVTLQCPLSSVKEMGIFLSITMARIKRHWPKINGKDQVTHVCDILKCLFESFYGALLNNKISSTTRMKFLL